MINFGLRVLPCIAMFLYASCQTQESNHQAAGNDSVSHLQLKDSVEEDYTTAHDTAIEINHGSQDQSVLDSLKKVKLEMKRKVLSK